MVKLNKVDEQVIAALKAEKELTLQELTEKTGNPSKKIFKSCANSLKMKCSTQSTEIQTFRLRQG